MANGSVLLDKWREYFRSSDSDIFDVIEHAIKVAASDCPYDFRLNRDRIAEILFTCKVTKCFGCDQIKLSLPNVNGSEKNDKKCKSGIVGGGSRDTKESKVNITIDDDDHREMNTTQVSNCSYGDAEALTDEIEEESQLMEEVLRIKQILDNNEEESDVLLLDSLRRLQLITLSVETLKSTEIGKSVNALRKHRSKEIRSLAKTLIENWTAMVEEWIDATEAIAAGTDIATESAKTSAIEEEVGLPSPPLDEGAFFATPTSMELSQFFDGMDDDDDDAGNPGKSGEFNMNRENGRRPGLENHNYSSTPKNRNIEYPRSQESLLNKQTPRKPNRILSGDSGPGRAMQPKVNNEIKVQCKPEKSTIQKKPMPPQNEKFSCNNEGSVRTKLEDAKRKLQERYQEAENAKKQRTIQVMELHELPKQNLTHRSQNMKPGNHNRHRAIKRK